VQALTHACRLKVEAELRLQVAGGRHCQRPSRIVKIFAGQISPVTVTTEGNLSKVWVLVKFNIFVIQSSSIVVTVI
jgi:ribosomal protein S4E